jgi:hypothetical protein
VGCGVKQSRAGSEAGTRCSKDVCYLTCLPSWIPQHDTLRSFTEVVAMMHTSLVRHPCAPRQCAMFVVRWHIFNHQQASPTHCQPLGYQS